MPETKGQTHDIAEIEDKIKVWLRTLIKSSFSNNKKIKVCFVVELEDDNDVGSIKIRFMM